MAPTPGVATADELARRRQVHPFFVEPATPAAERQLEIAALRAELSWVLSTECPAVFARIAALLEGCLAQLQDASATSNRNEPLRGESQDGALRFACAAIAEAEDSGMDDPKVMMVVRSRQACADYRRILLRQLRALATGGWGTALGVVRSLAAAGKRPHVYVGETRPYLQGARLTAWELLEEGIDHTLVCDSVAASVMPRCEAVLVGCDRVAANGDVANKIGTLGLAILAKHYGVPFYVCMPMSTLDQKAPTGADIPIEERSAAEVRGFGDVVWASESPIANPAFDITPAALVTAWVTEEGLWTPPDGA